MGLLASQIWNLTWVYLGRASLFLPGERTGKEAQLDPICEAGGRGPGRRCSETEDLTKL